MTLTAAQLEHLNTVAVQMLDPIVADPSSPAGEKARHQAISDRLNACATVANDLQLPAFSAAARQVAQTHIDSDSTNRVDKIENWIERSMDSENAYASPSKKVDGTTQKNYLIHW